MAVKKPAPKALSAVRGDFIAALQNVMDQGNLLISVLEAASGRGLYSNEKVGAMVEERLKAFSVALYGVRGCHGLTPPNDPKVVAKLLRAIAGGVDAKRNKHDTILICAADMLDPLPE